MKRINSIDTVRGFCMVIMIIGHSLDWWVNQESYWFRTWMFGFLETIAALGFLFISGVSTSLAFNKNLNNIRSKKNNIMRVRMLYFTRAFLILLIGFLYNIVVILIWGGEIIDIWSWLVLQTIGFSLVLSWPFLNTSRYLKIIVGLIVIFANQILLNILLPYEGQFNLYGLSFHLLFNPTSQYVILNYFGIFLIGTVIGDLFYDIITIKDEKKRIVQFKNKFIVKSLIIGTILMLSGIFFQFPNFLIYGTISSIIYAFGFILIVFSLLLTFEIFNVLKTNKRYRFLYFFSYYSFTIYLANNLLYFLFPGQLNYIQILIAWIVEIAFFGLLLRTMYYKIGVKGSLKAGISILSIQLAKKYYKSKLYDFMEKDKSFIKSDN